jgi:hypothetical protein
MPNDLNPVTVSGIRYRRKGYTPGLAASDMSGNPSYSVRSDFMAHSDMSRTPGLLGNIATSFKPGSGSNWRKAFSTAAGGANALMPYLSNIANSFRKPPMPAAPQLVGYVSPRKVNYSDQMAEADRQVRGANLGADQTLDGNTAAAVKMGNLTQGIRAKNSIQSAEANTNAELAGRTDQLNAGISLQNAGMKNQYNQELVERQIAEQQEQSANLSNATDKYIASQNEKAKGQLDLDKLSVYKQLWQNSGVYDRLLGTMKQQGINLPGITDDGTEKKGKGGYMKAYGEGGTISTAAMTDKYAPFGALASTIQKEGWGVTPFKDYSEYTPGYAAAGNKVMIDGKPTGTTVIRGGKNGLFDVFVRDNAGVHTDNYLMKGVDAGTAHSYFVNKGSTVNQRVDQLKGQTVKFRKGGQLKKAY